MNKFFLSSIADMRETVSFSGQMLDTRFKMQDSGFRIQGAGCSAVYLAVSLTGIFVVQILNRPVNIPTG
jgi:hypothetical protein